MHTFWGFFFNAIRTLQM